MNKTTHALVRAAAVAAALVSISFGSSALAQGKASISNLSFDDLPSPQFGGTKNKSFKPKDWLEVEAGITIPPMNREMEVLGSLDQVVVKWYVAVVEKASKRTMLLTKDITHINVPVDEEFYSAVYLSPNTLRRMTGTDRSAKRNVKAVAIEVLINGVKVAEESDGERAGWWRAPSLSRGDRYPLLNKYETPFKSFWWDRYAEIEERR